jgi:hypothetical protein
MGMTSYKHVFGAPDLFTKKYIVESSGEKEDLRASWTQTIPRNQKLTTPNMLSPHFAQPDRDSLFGNPLIHVQSAKQPQIPMNDIMRISADQFSSLINLATDSGPNNFDGRWIPMYSGYHVDEATYRRREREPFPGGNQGTMLVDPFSSYDARYQAPAPAASPLTLPPRPPKSLPQPSTPLTVGQLIQKLRGGQP